MWTVHNRYSLLSTVLFGNFFNSLRMFHMGKVQANLLLIIVAFVETPPARGPMGLVGVHTRSYAFTCISACTGVLFCSSECI